MEPPQTTASGWRPAQPSGIKMRACSNCSRLKMKCRWPAGPSPTDITACTRCDRLGIACSVPSNAPRKKRGKSNRVAQLEEKLDGIMSLLESNQKKRKLSEAEPPQGGDSPSPLTPDSQPSATPTWPAVPPEISEGMDNTEEHSPSSRVYVDRGVGDKVQVVPGFAVTFTEAAEYLKIYQRDYMHMFPFVIIEENTKPHELYYSAPALFWTIMASVAQTTAEVDGAMKKWMRQYLADHVVVRQERTLELLQAILVHLIWSSFHFYIDADSPTYINLAQNIVLDLKLDWPPDRGQVQRQSLLGAAWCHMNKAHLMARRKAHTPAEIRAVLGLHYASAVTMSMFRRGPGVAWNGYLAKCCESMAALCQHPLDEGMSASVRLQRIAHKGLSALPGTEYVWGSPATAYNQVHEMTLVMTRDSMDKFFESQRPEIRNSTIFQHLYRALLVRLYEPVLGMLPAAAAGDSMANTTALDPFRRTDMLWKLVNACKDFFAARDNLSLPELSVRPSTMTGFLAFAVVTASRVLLHEAEDWDPVVARRYFDFGGTIMSMADQFERADEWAEGAGRRRQMADTKMSLFEMYSRKMRWIRHWYETRQVSGGGGDVPDNGDTGPGAASMRPDGHEAAGTGAMPAPGMLGQNLGAGAAQPGEGMASTDQQPIPSFMPDFQFDEAFWQELLMSAQQPPFNFTIGNGGP